MKREKAASEEEGNEKEGVGNQARRVKKWQWRSREVK